MINKEIKKLSIINEKKTFYMIIFEYLIMASTIYVSEYFKNYFIYFFAIVLLGSRFHALGILLHESVHWRLFKSKKINDIVGEFILSFPIQITLHGYRKHHFSHHRNLNSEQDPDLILDLQKKEFDFPIKKNFLLKTSLLYFIGFFTIRGIKETGSLVENNKLFSNIRKILLITLLISSLYFGFWKLLIIYWVIPLFTSFQFFVFIRAITDHHAVSGKNGYVFQTRTLILNPIESFLFFPFNSSYHLEHHLHPEIPCYNLKKAHKLLNQDKDFFKKSHKTYGMLGLIKEITVK